MTKEDILDKEGFDFDAFQYENEYSAKAILKSMNIYAKEAAFKFYEWSTGESLDEQDKLWNLYIEHLKQQQP